MNLGGLERKAMAKEIPPEDDYDDGLAPPPNLPPMANSQTGTVAQAEALQQQNNVPERFRGRWFHGTYNDIHSLDNQHDDWTWFTRSPAGGTIWGETVLVAYAVAVPVNSKVHATSNKADKIGYEGEAALPDWWMSVGREDIPKLMVVAKFHQTNDEDRLKALMGTEDYNATRQAAIDKRQALNKPKPAG